MTLQVENNASSTVEDAPLLIGSLILNVAPGTGGEFPDSVNGNFRVTIWDQNKTAPSFDPTMEIVECTARNGDELTIIRGIEGTSAFEHTFGDNVSLLITAGVFNDPAQGIYNMDIDGGIF